jgi:uncharacterized membrane protein YphA (DoxX/SURF4 family)
MELAVWIVSWLLAVAFVVGGASRALVPPERLAGVGLAWVRDVPAPLLKTIGVLEVLGGLGLVLPVLTGILSVLTPIAACGLAVIMLGGLVFHLRRREWQGVPITLVLAAATIFVAVARFAGV